MELEDIAKTPPALSSTQSNPSSGRSPSRHNSSFARLPHSACFWPGVNDPDKYSGSNNVSICISNKSYGEPLKENIIARKFNLLHNAANRTRVQSPEQLGLSQDDSIVGQTPTIQDFVDGVGPLRPNRLSMTFDFLDAASLIFSMFSYLLDLVTDIAVATFHYLNGDYWYCGLTAAFIAVPNMLTTFISLRWYCDDTQIEGAEPVSRSQWILRIIFHIFQVGPILRYYESLQYGLRFREAKDPEEKKISYMRMIYEDADATMLRLFESFMESAPQLILQMYIITRNYPFNDYEYWTAILQVMSISSSLVSISWSLVSYSKSLRISLDNKVPMNYWSIAVMFSWEFFSMTARMIVLALFTASFVKYVGFVCIIHWLFMTCWILTMQTTFCTTKLEEIGFNAVLGIIFIFCYFNPVDNSTRYRYLAFYVIMFLENSALLYFWATYSNFSHSFKVLVLYTHYTSFFLGISLMLIYYRYFHPAGGIRLFREKEPESHPSA